MPDMENQMCSVCCVPSASVAPITVRRVGIARCSTRRVGGEAWRGTGSGKGDAGPEQEPRRVDDRRPWTARGPSAGRGGLAIGPRGVRVLNPLGLVKGHSRRRVACRQYSRARSGTVRPPAPCPSRVCRARLFWRDLALARLWPLLAGTFPPTGDGPGDPPGR